MSSQRGLTYTCSAGETFDGIALALYGNERLVYELLAANPSLCHMSAFQGGEILLIPIIVAQEDELNTGRGADAAPWKR